MKSLSRTTTITTSLCKSHGFANHAMLIFIKKYLQACYNMKRTPLKRTTSLKPGTTSLKCIAPMSPSSMMARRSKPMIQKAEPKWDSHEYTDYLEKKVAKSRRPPKKTEADRIYMGRAARLGCMLCRHLGLGETPAEVHHPRTGAGAGQRSPHQESFPLCFEHHRGQSGVHSMGRKAFERHYGVTELELRDQTRRLLGMAP